MASDRKTLAKAMRLKTDGRGRKRNYGKEYRDYHSKPVQKKNRVSRNKANAMVNPGPGKETQHKDGNPQNNSKGNLSEVTVAYNRADGNRRRKKRA